MRLTFLLILTIFLHACTIVIVKDNYLTVSPEGVHINNGNGVPQPPPWVNK